MPLGAPPRRLFLWFMRHSGRDQEGRWSMDTIIKIMAENGAGKETLEAAAPQCEKCGSEQVQLGVTTLNFGQPKDLASRNVVQGQWHHCMRCDHRWFVADMAAADVIQEAESY